MIEIQNIYKKFDSVRAVNGINLSIPPGCLFGLIGPDGAGKTTVLRMLTTLLIPDSGHILVFGADTVSDYKKIRSFTGYMPGRFSLYPDLTVEENLAFYATIFGTTIKTNYQLIQPVYHLLEPFKNRLASQLSGGMKQKLALCCALIHNPRLLVLDEPTTGVDSVSRKEFWETLHELKNQGMTIVVSTPYMDEAFKCEKIGLIESGNILIYDTPQKILNDYKTPLFEIRSEDRTGTLKHLRALSQVKRAYLFGHFIHVAMNDRSYDAQWLTENLTGEKLRGISVNNIEPDFEDCFIDAVELKKSTGNE